MGGGGDKVATLMAATTPHDTPTEQEESRKRAPSMLGTASKEKP